MQKRTWLEERGFALTSHNRWNVRLENFIWNLLSGWMRQIRHLNSITWSDWAESVQKTFPFLQIHLLLSLHSSLLKSSTKVESSSRYFAMKCILKGSYIRIFIGCLRSFWLRLWNIYDYRIKNRFSIQEENSECLLSFSPVQNIAIKWETKSRLAGKYDRGFGSLC